MGRSMIGISKDEQIERLEGIIESIEFRRDHARKVFELDDAILFHALHSAREALRRLEKA